MSKIQRLVLAALRLVTGWYFFYAGLLKIIDPKWSAAPFLKSAQMFPHFYQWFALPSVLPWVNLANEWGLLLLGLSLILGLWLKWTAPAGIVLMFLYYFGSVNFPHAGPNALVVDEHILLVATLLVLWFFRAGSFWGLERRR